MPQVKSRLNVRNLRTLLMLPLAGFLAGCGQVYAVKVDALRTAERAPRRTYHLVAAESGLALQVPRQAEVMEAVGRALDESGLFAASRAEWADMVVEVDLGIGPRRMIAVPDRQAADAAATAIYLPDRGGATVADSSGVQAPANQVKRVVFVWEKRLSVVACENLSTSSRVVRTGAELWRVDLSIQDGTPGFEGMVPVMAAALADSVDRSLPPSTVRYITAAEVGNPAGGGLH